MENLNHVFILYIFSLVVVAVCGAPYLPETDEIFDPLSPSPGISPPKCSTVIFYMTPCLTYLIEDPADNEPNNHCCVGINKIIEKTDVSCVCYALASSKGMGVEFNATRIESLPSRCGIKLPTHTTWCNAAPDFPEAPLPPESHPSPSQSNSGAKLQFSFSLILGVVVSFL